MKNKILIILVLIGGIIFLLVMGVDKLERKSGPHDFIADKHICRFCKMHVRDVRFAGQIQTDSQTFFYDDMGCLIKDQKKIKDPITAVYYQHYFEDRWISEDDVAFFQVPESPMGYNLGAISQDDSESVVSQVQRIGLSQAKIQVFNKDMSQRKMKNKKNSKVDHKKTDHKK